MPDLYFKVTIHQPKAGFSVNGIQNLADQLMDVAAAAFPLAEIIITTISKPHVNPPFGEQESHHAMTANDVQKEAPWTA